jgi:hypothetical protein
MKIIHSLILVSTAAAGLTAQTVYVPVNAPYAQELVIATKGAHPELQKLGLHAIPPGQQEYAIIANAIPSKIGKKSSASDLVVLRSGQPTVKNNDHGKFFDLCLPISDASGHGLGITVMEIPYGSARDSADALAKASAVRDEMQGKISSHHQLFAETSAPLKPMEKLAFPSGLKGHFDHFTADLKHNRLFATAEDYHAVLVYDLVSGELTSEIRGIAKPHAVLYREDLDRIFVTDGEAGALKIFDGKSYAPLGGVALEKDADSIGYEPARKYLYVVSGGKDAGQSFSLLTVIDTTAAKKVAEMRIEGDTLEAMAVDAWRPRMWVNNKARNQVEVVDRWKNVVTASWPVTMGKDNVAMALDEAHQRLFVGCRSGHVVVFDSNTGKELQALAIARGVDDMQYDAASKRLYAIGGGTIDVFEETDADHFKPLGSVPAGAQAKTGRLVPEINRYFAAVPPSEASAGAVAVFQPLNIPIAKPAATPAAEVVHAPHALELDLVTMSAHPDLRKMGLHAIPPGGKTSVIIANANTTRIGIPSSAGDLDAVKEGKTYCVSREDGSFFNLKLPLQDASGKTIGILVMEMPFTSAANEDEAKRKAEGIRRELAQRIPDYNSLFR